MTATQVVTGLHVEPVAAGRFRVSGGAQPHLLTLSGEAIACDCADAHFRQHACKHVRALRAHLLLAAIDRDAAPVLDCIHEQLEARPSQGVRRWWRHVAHGAPAERRPAVLAQWRRELSRRERTPYTFDAVWRAACEAMNALE